MSLAAAVNSILRSDDATEAIVADKVWPLNVAQYDPADPETHPPFLTYEVRRDATFDTLGDGPADYRPADIEVGVYALDYDQCDQLSAAVSDLLSGYGGIVAGVGIDTDFVTETDIEEATPEGEEYALSVRTQTYRALYRQIPE